MASQRSESDWPVGFAPWPHDLDGQQAWLTLQPHSNFSRWTENEKIRGDDGRKADRAANWEDLQILIETVLNISQCDWSDKSKEVYGQMFAETTKNHTYEEEMRTIAGLTAIKVLGHLAEVPTNERVVAWAKQAFFALAPRMVSLAKKSISKKVASGTITAHPRTPTISKAAQLDSGSLDSLRQTSQSPLASSKRSKGGWLRQKQEHNTWDGHARVTLPHKTNNTGLCDRDIVVRFEKKGDYDMDRIRSVEVAVSAILEEEVQRQHQLDIRCEHVSWGKFVGLLKEMDETLDIQRKKLLYSAEEGGFESEEIEDERDFRRAIGTLDWNARQQNKQMALMMHMMDRYGY